MRKTKAKLPGAHRAVFEALPPRLEHMSTVQKLVDGAEAFGRASEPKIPSPGGQEASEIQGAERRLEAFRSA